MARKIVMAVLGLLLLGAPAMAALPEGDLIEGVAAGTDGKIDVLAVFAHQDDETFYPGGTLIKLKKDPRVRLHILCMTIGDKSSAMGPLGISEEHQGRIRNQELQTAAAVMNADQVIMLGYHDQGLASADQAELVAKVRGFIEEVGAEIVVTHDPAGVSGHQDHQTTSRVTTEAFRGSTAQKLYYASFPEALYRLFYHGEVEPAYPTFRVDIRKEKKLKRLALYAHATQKHFSDIGILMEIVRTFDYEYFALGGENHAGGE